MSRLIRTIFIYLTVVGMTLSSSAGMARAHVLKEDKGISAVLHIPPDDNPAAGEPTELNLAFGDSANAFSLQNCNCKVIIMRDGQIVQTAAPKPALQGATLNSLVTVNFPSVAVYDVLVKGSAVNGRFPTFRLDFLVRVGPGANSPPASNAGSTAIIIGAGSLVILGLFAYASISSGGRYKTVSKVNKPRSKK